MSANSANSASGPVCRDSYRPDIEMHGQMLHEGSGMLGMIASAFSGKTATQATGQNRQIGMRSQSFWQYGPDAIMQHEGIGVSVTLVKAGRWR